jgi:hypothetical protein
MISHTLKLTIHLLTKDGTAAEFRIYAVASFVLIGVPLTIGPSNNCYSTPASSCFVV